MKINIFLSIAIAFLSLGLPEIINKSKGRLVFSAIGVAMIILIWAIHYFKIKKEDKMQENKPPVIAPNSNIPIGSIGQKGGKTIQNVNINNPPAKDEEPTINISLIYISAYGFYFVLENPSDEDAQKITLDIELRPGQPNPFQQKVYKETFPIKTIYAKDKKQIQTIINPSLNIAYDATWRWQGKKGETFSRQDEIKFSPKI